METGGIADGVEAAVKTAFQGVADDTTGMMTDVLPYALAVMGLGWGVSKVKGFFKRAS